MNNDEIYVVQSVSGRLWYAGEYDDDWQYSPNLSDATRYSWDSAIDKMNWLNDKPRSLQRWTVRVATK